MPINSINPANGTLLGTFAPLADEAAQEKIALARSAFESYASVPLSHRELWMNKLAALLDAESDELAALITSEMGKPITQARAEVAKCALGCRYYAEHAARILAPEPVDIGANEAYVRWDPLGVVLAVMPWNFPLWQVFRFLAPALMAGNAGLLKHASNVPQCALAIESLVRRAGFPRGIFQTLLIEARQVEHILADERVAAVTVTGSEGAGRSIAAQAGWFLKKSVLELGGSDAFIVMPSGDLDAAVKAAAKARTVNNGQSCICAKRFLVADAIYDEFEARFVEAMDALKIGDPMQESTEIGPLATEAQVNEPDAQVQDGGEGRRAAGPPAARAWSAKATYAEPMVLAGVPPECAGLPRGAVRSCGDALPRPRHGGRGPRRQRYAVRPGCFGCGRKTRPSSGASPMALRMRRSSSSMRSWPAIRGLPFGGAQALWLWLASCRQPGCASSSTPSTRRQRRICCRAACRSAFQR